MYSASRYYGWPNSFILVNKTTEFFDEAKKIETENLISLIKNDWKISFKADQFGKYGMTSVAIFNLVINYLFCLGISYTIINTTNFFCKNKI